MENKVNTETISHSRDVPSPLGKGRDGASVLGAAMSGLVTCIDLMGNESIVEKIKNA